MLLGLDNHHTYRTITRFGEESSESFPSWERACAMSLRTAIWHSIASQGRNKHHSRFKKERTDFWTHRCWRGIKGPYLRAPMAGFDRAALSRPFGLARVRTLESIQMTRIGACSTNPASHLGWPRPNCLDLDHPWSLPTANFGNCLGEPLRSIP